MLPTIPIVRTAYAVLGIAMTGAGRVLYNEDIWNPTGVLPKWTGPGGRFMAFCCGCLWLLAQVSTNVSANSAPFGHDAMSLAPSWINVRRGSVICMMIGSWAMVPWLAVNTASKFISFMNGYGCFICSMVSIALADYFLIRRRKLDVPGLYDPHGRYRYHVCHIPESLDEIPC
jgi:NCS1 family nucleobase:cation symporter-1